MYAQTNNPYKFQYLVTGITGPGIDQVYIPEEPPDKDVLFKKEQKFVRPQMSASLRKWIKEARVNGKNNPDYVHPQQAAINEWEDKLWDWTTNGICFWNNGKKTYITPFYAWYLTSWQTYFGYPVYRETDKEITYWIQYWEEDPDAYGGALNTIRRYGKSSLMGAWIVYRATRNFNHNAGMQGESDKKIKKFYRKMVLKPFYKLPYYFQPTWNTDTKQTNEIEFDLPPKRGNQLSSIDTEDKEVLESMIDYRSSGEGEYDGDVVNSYISEEPGKCLETSIYNDEGEGTWDIVKPCLRKGRQIRGKAFFGTTVENMNANDRGGKAYKALFYDSDFNQRQADGRTRSGLYAAFLPGDCAYEDFLDEWGHPMREESRAQLMKERDSFKNNPRKLAGLIRKYPLSIMEIFYVSPDRCEYNAIKLQNQIREIDISPDPLTSKFDLYWEGGKRFTKVLWRHNPTSGWAEFSWIPPADQLNLVGKRFDPDKGKDVFFPMNDGRVASGIDPIQHGSVKKTGRESRPVQYVKTKYDSSIDGQWTHEEMSLMSEPGKMVDGKWVLDPAGKPYSYKTNRYFLQMQQRPMDPNVWAERVLMICWLLGVSVHVEKQFGGFLINYFHEHNCGDFILYKYKPDFERPDKVQTEGSSANTSTIQEYTAANAAYIEYFCHLIPFRELCESHLAFDASNTTEHDHSVAGGWTELACKMRPKIQPKPIVNVTDLFDQFNPYTNELLN